MRGQDVERRVLLRRHVADNIAAIRLAGSGMAESDYAAGFGAALDTMERACGLTPTQSGRWEPVRHAYLVDDIANTLGGLAVASRSTIENPMFGAGYEDALVAIGTALGIGRRR